MNSIRQANITYKRTMKMDDQIADALRLARNLSRYERLNPIAPVSESAPSDTDYVRTEDIAKNANDQISAEMAAAPDSSSRLASVTARGLGVVR